MMRLSMVLVVFTVLGGARVSAQVADPPKKADATQDAAQKKLEQDPKALALLDASSERIYRPRDAGMKDLTCRCSLKSTREIDTFDFGSATLEWTADKHRFINFKNSPGERDFQGFVNDLVGFRTMALVKEQFHIKIEKENVLRLTNPSWSQDKSFSHMFLFIDAKRGVFSKQEVYTSDGKLGAVTVFEFSPKGKKWLTAKKVIDFKIQKVTREVAFKFQEVQGITIASAIAVKMGAVTTTMEIGDVKLNTGLKME